MIKKLLDLIELLIDADTENFFYELKLGQYNTGTDFTEIVKHARESNDRRAKLKNEIEVTLLELLKKEGINIPEEGGNIVESFSFLIDAFIISHLKIWFSEYELRELNKLPKPSPDRVKFLVDASRSANNNRIKLRKKLEDKIVGLINGTESAGDQDPKIFKAKGRD